MTIEQASMDNDILYEPEAGFWVDVDRLDFEARNLLAEWPKASNPFISRMAGNVESERGIQNIAVADFKQLIGTLVAQAPDVAYRFMVIPMDRVGISVSVRLLEKTFTSLPPVQADNACSFELAMTWLARTYSHFELSCAAGATFWVRKQ